MSESRTGTNTHPAYPNWGTKHQPAMTIGASGAGLGLAHARCHEGFTLMSFPHRNAEDEVSIDHAVEDTEAASSVTVQDRQRLRTGPPPCPKVYEELMKMLVNYLRAWSATWGEDGSHYVQTRRIYNTLAGDFRTYSLLTPEQIAGIVWEIFRDSRQYFEQFYDGQDQDTIPESNLTVFWTMSEVGHTRPPIGTPLHKLLPPPAVPILPLRDDKGPAKSKRVEEIFEAQDQANPSWNPRVQEVMEKILRVQPDISILSLAH